MIFYVGLHQPAHAQHFGRCMVSVARLRGRVGDFPASQWMLDSGAFMELKQHGRYRDSVETYAAQVRRWAGCGQLLAAVSQDYMCEPFILGKTGLTVAEHQRLTLGRYLELQSYVGSACYVLPVLQGYDPAEYVAHLRQYGTLLGEGQWVGVGSVCKRNAQVEEIENVLVAIQEARPDLRLHGFGVKVTALESRIVRDCLWSADSMAWSYSARKQGRDGNSWREARRFVDKIEGQRVRGRQFQRHLF